MSTYVPDNWVIGEGAWNTDYELDVVVFKTLDASVKLKSTIIATEKTIYTQETVPAAPGDTFYVGGWVRADRRDVGDTCYFGVTFYDSTGAWLANGTALADRVAVVDTWEYYSAIVTAPANTAHMRGFAVKLNTAFNMWFDGIDCTHAVKNQHVDPAAGIVGTKLTHGAGVLAHLAATGVLDNLTSVTTRILDDVADGATYGKVKGAGLTVGVVNSTGLVAGAVIAGKLADGAVDTAGRLASGVVTSSKVADSAIRPTHTSNAVLSVGVLRNSTHNHWRTV